TVDVPSTGALDLDVEVEAGDRLRGFVTRASDGRGVPGATIEVYDAVSGRLATTTAGLDGRYEVRGLSIGPKQLTVRADGFAVHGPVELDVDLPDDATADVALQPGSGISGTVLD